MDKINIGDVVVSLCGRDKGELLLVIATEGKFVYVVNGYTRKATSPKRKNVKHINMVKSAADTKLAENIKNGLPVSDKRVRRSVSSVKDYCRREDLCRKTTL